MRGHVSWRCEGPWWSAASTSRGNASRNTAASKRRAFSMQASGSTPRVEAADRLGELVGTALPETAGDPVQHVLEQPARRSRYHGPPGGLGLHGGDPELLGARDDERRQVASRRAASASLTRPAKRIVGPASRLSRRLSGPPPAIDERRPQAVERLDRHVDLLVRDELRQHQVVAPDRLPAEALGRDRRVDDLRVAPEVRLDARLRGPRVRHVAVHALRRDPVPLAPAPEQAAQRRARERVGALRERAVALVPGVPERVVAVATRARRARRRSPRAPTRSSSRSRGRSPTGRRTRSPPGRAAGRRGSCARSAGAAGGTRCGSLRSEKRPSVPRSS